MKGATMGTKQTQAAFTKGAWKVKTPKPARFPEYAIEDADGNRVAAVQICANNPAGANAHLIAAAPALYEALEALLAKVECGTALHCELCDEARAALRQARGEA